jgi:polar amino acid transport system permease protein
VSLALVLLGTLIVITIQGWAPVDTLVASLKSGALRAVLVTGLVGGCIAALLGFPSHGRMATKVSREETLAGGFLGIQAIQLSAFLLWFTGGNVEIFALNYLDFKSLAPHMDTFLNAIKNTVVLAFIGQFFGILLGLTLSVLAISKRAVVRAPARMYINFFRGTPLVWQIIFIGVGLPLGLRINIPTYTAAAIALSLNTGAYAAEVFRAGIQSIERGQLEAARGLGMSYMQAMRYAVVPQAIRRVIPPLLNEFVILIKDTSLVLVLGLTAVQRDLMSWGNFGNANFGNATFLIVTAMGYLAVTLPLIRVVNAVEKRLRSGLVGITA